MASQKRSGTSLHPAEAKRSRAEIDDFHEFATDVKATVGRMLPTAGRRYQHAAILAINFSISDIQGVVPLRDELLDLLAQTYNWRVEKYTINSAHHHQHAGFLLKGAVQQFFIRNASPSEEKQNLLCVYFSGHGFQGPGSELNICGELYSNGRAKAPWIPWSVMSPAFTGIPSWNHVLMLMDCCSGGLANINDGDIEVLGAAAWESRANASPQACFTSAIINELNALHGDSITSTQLVSRLHCIENVRRRISQPVHKRRQGDHPPALIHRIESTPAPPLRQITTTPKYAHVLISVKVGKSNTVPDAEQWSTWLKTNLPSYVDHISLEARWETSSALVVVIIPIEIWLDLPDKEAYTFMQFHYKWKIALQPKAGNLPLSSPGRGRKIQGNFPFRGGDLPRPGPSGSR